ncbi:MAG: TonB-dependent receptor domain-containing protein [Opitutaceae bacterium]
MPTPSGSATPRAPISATPPATASANPKLARQAPCSSSCSPANAAARSRSAPTTATIQACTSRSTRPRIWSRAAYAKTYGRPNFNNIIPRTTITPADLDEDDPIPATGRGRLDVRNASLKPWTADNYDLSAEYYTPQGGLLSAGVFVKDIKDFFGGASRIATAADIAELGLDPQYVGWTLNTQFNSGDARITGAEINVRHSLRFLGRWGSYFTLFANGTKLDLDGGPGATFASFIPKTGNWGGTFSARRFTITARWNYRGLDQRGPQASFGPDGYEYFKERITLDMNATYQLTRRLSLAASVNNVTNQPQTLLRYGSQTPDYARQFREAEYGVAMAVGLRGTF